jgi:hypothetical protein
VERNPDGTPKGYPCCDRRFPDPDPVFRYIHQDEGPSEFWLLPHDERSRRLRAYLLAIASGAYPIVAWMTAMDFEKETIDAIHQLIDVENRDDRRLEMLVANGAHPAERARRLSLAG